MRLPRMTMRRWMVVVITSALILAPFAWTAPGLRWGLFIGSSTVGVLLLIVASPFLLDRLGRNEPLGSRTGLACGSAPPVRPRPIRRLSRKW
jgi:hypothetical protein